MWRRPSWGAAVGVCFLSTPKTPSQAGLEHLPHPSLGYLLPPSHYQLEAAPGHPAALPPLLPGHCFSHRGLRVPTTAFSNSFPEYQCQDQEHHKLTINKGRREEAARLDMGLQHEVQGVLSPGIIIIFIRIKLDLNVLPLFKCPQPLLLRCKSALVTRDYGAARLAVKEESLICPALYFIQ